MPPELKQRDRTRSRRIQRSQRATQRNASERVAALAHEPGEPCALGPDDDDYGVCRQMTEREDGGLRIGVETDDPRPMVVSHTKHRRRQTADERHGEPLDCTRGGFGDRRRDVDVAVRREDDAGNTRAVRATQERTQVLRVGEAVDSQHKRWTAGSDYEKFVDVDIDERRGVGDHALRRFRAGLAEEMLSAHTANGNARLCGELFDLGEYRRFVVAVGQPDVAHSPTPGEEKLTNRLSSLDLITSKTFRA